MEKENKNNAEEKDAYNKKLDHIIEQSKAENDAFKKLLEGLEQINKKKKTNEDSRKENKLDFKKRKKKGI